MKHKITSYALDLKITDDDFELPASLADLQQTIEDGLETYNPMPKSKQKREFKITLNELIDVYNERRQMKIYNHV